MLPVRIALFDVFKLTEVKVCTTRTRVTVNDGPPQIRRNRLPTDEVGGSILRKCELIWADERVMMRGIHLYNAATVARQAPQYTASKCAHSVVANGSG